MSSTPKIPSSDHDCRHKDRAADRSPATPSKTVGKYFCPMCDGVESDKPGACPMCGMALEHNPAYVEPKRTGYTCPMHPEVRQDHPGACPICGMALEPVTTSAIPEEEENAELRDMTRRFWIGVALTLPVLILSMGEFV